MYLGHETVHDLQPFCKVKDDSTRSTSFARSMPQVLKAGDDDQWSVRALRRKARFVPRARKAIGVVQGGKEERRVRSGFLFLILKSLEHV